MRTKLSLLNLVKIFFACQLITFLFSPLAHAGCDNYKAIGWIEYAKTGKMIENLGVGEAYECGNIHGGQEGFIKPDLKFSHWSCNDNCEKGYRPNISYVGVNEKSVPGTIIEDRKKSETCVQQKGSDKKYCWRRVKDKLLPDELNDVSIKPDRTTEPNTPNKLKPCPTDQKARYHECFGVRNFENGENYVGEWRDDKKNGQGTATYADGDKYVGAFKDGRPDGRGTYTFLKAGGYVGEWRAGLPHGQGILTLPEGTRSEGIFENGKFIREAKINQPIFNNNNVASNADRSDIERERQQLAEERRKLDEDRRQREKARNSQRINLQVTNTEPATDGTFTLNIQTNADTSSLRINGNEAGGRQDGKYTLKLVARAGQKTDINIVATDIYGNTDEKTITVAREIVDSKVAFAALNPAKIKHQSDRDAVAIIIGIADYKNLPKADFANDDARLFYDYAIRALGVKAENIKLLVDADADEIGIYRAFKTWLPSRVRSTTDVYVYYSGHGLPTADGQGLYVVPQRADKDFIDKTAITQAEINEAIQSTKPKSVMLFLDACYSGQARTGETLLASARPLALKAQSNIFPNGFNVFSASQSDQISSSSPDIKHGIFSYYLMRGMEGDADSNKDGKITLGEMQSYLAENVTRHAGMMNRKQEPQLIGDVKRVLVGK